MVTRCRENLFSQIAYTDIPTSLVRGGIVPKIDVGATDIFRMLVAQNELLGARMVSNSAHIAYAHRIVAHYVKAFDFVPYFQSERW